MRLKRFTAGVALSALLATSAVAQTAPQPQTAPQASSGQAAGALNPAAEASPTRQAPRQFLLSDGIIAKVGDQIITSFDLRQRMLMLIIQSQVQPTQENLPILQQEALDALIEERLQAREIANFEELKITDEMVDQEIADYAREVGATPESYLKYLVDSGVRAESFREQLRTSMGWRELVGGRFGSRARPSRSAVQQAVRQLSEASSRKQYLIGEIYIEAARVGGMQQAVNGAQQLIQQMIQGAPFQAVARQFSAAPSVQNRVPGDAGWIVEGSAHPALQQAFDNLQVGELSNPIVVEGGVYIIYMRDKREGASTSLVDLKQVMIELPETASEAEVQAASQRLQALAPSLTCDTMLERAKTEQGLLGAEFPRTDVQNLPPQFQQVGRSAQIGTVSSPVRTPLGVHLLAVCGRAQGAAQVPPEREVEARLRQQNLAMLARRYMRDLRQDSLIEIAGQ